MEFQGFGKIPRLNRDIIITEKLDGTNAQIVIGENGEFRTGSRNRWITPENDNAGFSRWAHENRESLMELGPGQHFGEWWGKGIQRGYDLDEKRFSLFNASRWTTDTMPECCHVVPVLYSGPFDQGSINWAKVCLTVGGSEAAPGFMRPEGIIVFHTAGNNLFKVLLENDEGHKGN